MVSLKKKKKKHKIKISKSLSVEIEVAICCIWYLLEFRFLELLLQDWAEGTHSKSLKT